MVRLLAMKSASYQPPRRAHALLARTLGPLLLGGASLFAVAWAAPQTTDSPLTLLRQSAAEMRELLVTIDPPSSTLPDTGSSPAGRDEEAHSEVPPGTPENSPAIHRWVRDPQETQAPEGRQNDVQDSLIVDALPPGTQVAPARAPGRQFTAEEEAAEEAAAKVALLEKLKDERVLVQKRFIEATNRVHALRAMPKESLPEALQAIRSNAALTTARLEQARLQEELTKLSANFKLGHPRVMAVAKPLEEVTARIEREVELTMRGLRTEAELEGKRIDALNKALAEVTLSIGAEQESSIAVLQKAQADYLVAETRYTSARNQYESLRVERALAAKRGIHVLTNMVVHMHPELFAGLVSDYDQAAKELSAKQAVFGPRHPEIEKHASALERIRKQIDARFDDLSERQRIEMEAKKAAMNERAQQVAQAKEQLKTPPDANGLKSGKALFIGSVRGSISLTPDTVTTLSQALTSLRPSEFVDLKYVELQRPRADGTYERTILDLNAIRRGGDTPKDIPLQDGDVVRTKDKIFNLLDTAAPPTRGSSAPNGAAAVMPNPSTTATSDAERLGRTQVEPRHVVERSVRGSTPAAQTSSLAPEQRYAEAKARYEQLRKLPPERLAQTLVTIRPDNLLQQLMRDRDQMSQQLTLKRTELGPEHPEVTKAKASLEHVKKQIDDRVEGVMEGLRIEVEITKAALTSPVGETAPGKFDSPPAETKPSPTQPEPPTKKSSKREAIEKKLDSIVFKEPFFFAGLPLDTTALCIREQSQKRDPEGVGVNARLQNNLLLDVNIDMQETAGLTLRQMLDLIVKGASSPIFYTVDEDGILFVAQPSPVPAKPVLPKPQSSSSVDPSQAAADEALRRANATTTLLQTLVRARDARRRSQLDEAAGHYEHCLRIVQQLGGARVEDEAKEAREGLEYVRIKLARELAEKLNFDEADQQMQALLQYVPDSQRGREYREYNRQVAAAHKGRIPSADVRAQAAQAQETKARVGTLVADGKLLYELARLDESEARLKEAIRLDPANQAAYYYMRLIHEARYAQEARRRDLTQQERLLEVEKAWNNTRTGSSSSLSPQWRNEPRVRGDSTSDAISTNPRQPILPLPEGEGRGEGEG
ncbi:MAG: hypothetical protein AB1705_13815, partial [Verrucomicrobiota bacterium]